MTNPCPEPGETGVLVSHCGTASLSSPKLPRQDDIVLFVHCLTSSDAVALWYRSPDSTLWHGCLSGFPVLADVLKFRALIGAIRLLAIVVNYSALWKFVVLEFNFAPQVVVSPSKAIETPPIR
jgi:hypothetical protein